MDVSEFLELNLNLFESEDKIDNDINTTSDVDPNVSNFCSVKKEDLKIKKS